MVDILLKRVKTSFERKKTYCRSWNSTDSPVAPWSNSHASNEVHHQYYALSNIFLRSPYFQQDSSYPYFWTFRQKILSRGREIERNAKYVGRISSPPPHVNKVRLRDDIKLKFYDWFYFNFKKLVEMNNNNNLVKNNNNNNIQQQLHEQWPIQHGKRPDHCTKQILRISKINTVF